MKKMGAFEAKTHFSQLLSQVEKGKTIIITKHGRSIAKILPISAEEEIPPAIKAAKMIRSLRQGVHLGKDLSIKKLRELGRK